MDINNKIFILVATIIIIFQVLYYIYLKKCNQINEVPNRMTFRNLVMSIIIAIILGVIINIINSENLIKALNTYHKYIHYLFIGITILLPIEIFFYRNSKLKITKKYTDILSYITYTALLTLIATKNVNIGNFVCSIMWSSIFYSFQFYGNVLKEGNLLINERNNEPITKKTQLYPQRRTELEHIENYINEHAKNSSCTISICADWGEGKTSFINVMKKEIDNKKDHVIFIQPMIMDSRESLIEYFFSQMQDIMRKEGIYTGKGSSINNYFNSIMKIIGKDSKGFFENIFVNNDIESKDYRKLKTELQNDIDKLLSINLGEQGKLILFVDDFDRVDETVMYHVLTFIKEIASFKGCLVIFLMDYKNIKGKSITYEYLDKFVSKRFELKKISRDEIVKYYIYNNIYLNENSVEQQLIEEQYRHFKECIYTYLSNIEKTLEIKKQKIEDHIEENKRESTQKSETSNEVINCEKLNLELNNINEYIKKYKELSSNPRRIKKILTEIEDTCKFLHKKYHNDKEDDIRLNYQVLNCNEIIFNMSIIKILFEAEFDELLDSLDIAEYIENIKDTNIISILFGMDIQDMFKEIPVKRQEEIYKFINENFINSYRYAKSITEIRTRNEEILQKLEKGIIHECEENYEILDVLKAIYTLDYEINTDKVKDQVELLYDYIVYMIDNNKIKFNQIIDIVLDHKSRRYYNDNIKNVKIILEYIILKLLNEKYTYVSIQEKERNLYSIKNFSENVIFKSKSIISVVLRCANINNNSYDYDTIYETIRQKENIKGINSFATATLGIQINRDDKHIKETQILSGWIEESIKRFKNNTTIEPKYKERLGYTQQYMEHLVKVIKILEDIESTINENEVKPTYEIGDMYIFDNVENLEREINMLRKHVSNIDTNTNMKKVYIFFDQIIATIYKLLKSQNTDDESSSISDEYLEDLKDIYDKLNGEYKEEYLDPLLWSYCTFNMINIIKIMESKVTA